VTQPQSQSRPQKQTTLSIWCERIIEAGWLLALTLIPIYFNLLSARHFEPDKATTLRSIVLIMAAFAIIRALELLSNNDNTASTSARAAPPPTTTVANPLASVGKWLVTVPMALPVLIYVAIFIFSTITSIVPHTSLWGSYQRLQGTYTNVSYIMLAILIVMHMRKPAQLERLITIVLVTGLMVSFYGVMQHSGYDPLPWRGDVVERVASTMGNAIFVAAYLITVVPLALYRIIKGIGEVKRAPSSPNPMADVLWSGAYAILILGTMALLVSAIKFGASVQTADFRYWWVFPGAVVVSTALWFLLTLGLQHQVQRKIPLWPGLTFGAYVLLLIPMFLVSAGGDKQQVNPALDQGISWWLWLLISLAAVVIFYAMAFFSPQTPQVQSKLNRGLTLLGTIAVLFSLILTILYSQSRGPLLGLGAGMFVFILFFLMVFERRYRRAEQRTIANWLRIGFGGWILVAVAGLAFILLLNFSESPTFRELRKVPLLGRMSDIFETRYGTSAVRAFIWTGDEFAGGTIGLITSEPFRTVVGWGPESMFVAFNPFYPPSLAHLEARTASPDRAHQAVLDQLVTRGVLGLISYFFLLISFAFLAWQIMWKDTEWQWQLLAIATFSMVTAHVMEGMTGIPIVSTLTMLWTSFAITIVTGLFAGLYTLTSEDLKPTPTTDTATTAESDDAPALATETVQLAAADDEQADTAQEEKPTTTTTTVAAAMPKGEQKPEQQGEQKGEQKSSKRKGSKGSKRKGSNVQRGASNASTSTGRATPSGRRPTSSGAPQRNQPRGKTSAPALAFYALLLILTLGAVWKLNISVVYADMRFHEGETFSNIPNAGINEQVYGLDKYLEAIRQTPKEDFYYLNLGRSLMSLAEIKRSAGNPAGTEKEAEVEDLLQYQGINEVGGFVQQETPMGLMSYARAVLRRAYDLNPMNKDHSANLARLHNYWFNWSQDPEKLRIATEWYEEANTVAPYDVSLINESAGVHQMYSNVLSSQGKPAEAQTQLAKAEELYQRSLYFDPLFGDADVRLAELYRQQGRMEEAADLYAQAIGHQPHKFDDQVETLATIFGSTPDLLERIRDAYVTQAESENDARLHAIAGLLSVRLGDMEQAATSYDQSVEIDPDDPGSRKNYTIILSDTKEYQQALTQATAALTLTQQQVTAVQTPTQQQIEDLQQLQYLVNLMEQSVARENGDTQ
jgi:tetratricopeptide (TPR) repeat protein